MSTVTLNIQRNVAYLTINRADKRNAFTQAMWQALANYCDELSVNERVKVVVIAAKGDKAFSAGADIEELTHMITNPEQLKANNIIVQQAQQKLEQLNKPTIAAINGVCVGGGLGLALCCDFRIAVSHAKFGITPAKLGLLYSERDTKRLIDIVGIPKAKELLYLGKIIDTNQAFAIGLVSELCSYEQLEAQTNELIKQLLMASSTSISGIKKTIEVITAKTEENLECVENNAKSIAQLFDEAFTGDDFKEGAQAFLEKRSPRFNHNE